MCHGRKIKFVLHGMKIQEIVHCTRCVGFGCKLAIFVLQKFKGDHLSFFKFCLTSDFADFERLSPDLWRLDLVVLNEEDWALMTCHNWICKVCRRAEKEATSLPPVYLRPQSVRCRLSTRLRPRRSFICFPLFCGHSRTFPQVPTKSIPCS